MGKQTGFSLIKQVDKKTPFNEALRATQLLQLVYAISGLVYLLAAKLMTTGETLPHGFVQWPEQQYQLLLLGAGVVTALIVGVTFLVLPKFTTPDVLIKKKAISTLEELGYELRQAQVLKITVMQIPAILGLILFLFNWHWLHMIPFVLVTLFLLAATFPREEAWEEAKTLFETEEMLHS